MADVEVGKVKYRVELDNSDLNKDVSQTENTIASKLDGISGTLNKQFGYTILKDVGGAIASAGKALVGFAADSVQVGQTFDAAMSQVAATMGITTDQIGELRDFAQEMGATTQFSATQAAEALNYMALAGYDAETSMEMMPNVLNLAAAGAMDLARASDMVTDASSALGLDLEQTTEMVDQMAKAASKSNTSVAQLGDAILTVGGTAKQLTGGTTELSTALGILADSGIKGAEGGTHLRNILLALSPQTDKAANAMEALGFTAYDAEGNLRPLNDVFSQLQASLDGMTTEERQNVLSDIFNKTDLAAVDAMLSAAAFDIDQIDAAVQGMNIDWSNAQHIFDDWGESTEAGIQTVTSLVQEWVLAGTEQETTLNYLRDIIGLTEEDAESLIQTVSDSMADQGNRWTELTGYIDDAAGSAKEMAETQMDNLKGDITEMKSAFEGVQIAISDALTPTLREFVGFGTTALQDLGTAFKEGGLSGAVEAFGQILNDGITLIVSKAPELVSAGMKLIESLAMGLIDNLDVILDAALDVLLVLVDGLIENIPKLIDAALKIVTKLSDFIIEHVDLITEKGVELIAALVAGLIKAIPDIIRAVPKLVQAIWKTFQNTNWLSLGVDIIRGIARGISSAAGEIMSAARTAAENALNSVKSFLGIHSPSKRAAQEIGEPYAQGVAEGIDEGTEDITDSVTNMGRSMLSDLHLPDLSGWTSGLNAAISATAQSQITVVSELDGREIARGTAWYMNEQLAWEER
jgi:TP901 family phage tail tape measure protein